MKHRNLAFLAGAAVLATGLALAGQRKPQLPSPDLKEINIGGQTLRVEVADSESERIRGLSNRPGVEGDGMLFIIDPPARQTFWMKDMNFGLDLIWISNGQIVKIDHRVPAPPAGTPPEKLALYASPMPVSLVLEIPAGRAQEWGIGTSDAVSYTPLKQRE